VKKISEFEFAAYAKKARDILASIEAKLDGVEARQSKRQAA